MQRLFRLGEFNQLFMEVLDAPETRSYKTFFSKTMGTAYRGAYPPLLKKLLAAPITWEQLDKVKLLLPDQHNNLYTYLAPEADPEEEYPFYIDDLKDIVLLQNLEEICSFAQQPLEDISPLLECENLKVLRDHAGLFTKDEASLAKLQERGVIVSNRRPPAMGWSD